MPKGNRYDAEHLRNISSYLRQIDEIYKAADEEAARIVKASGAEYDPDKVFSFDDYPSVRKRVDKLTADLSSRVERTIVNGIKAQWELSNRKNDDLVETVTGLKADDFPSDQRRRYFATNESARDAFIKRERDGMDFSTKVWKRETELSADLSLKDFHDRLEKGMTEGMSADEMSRELRDYLKHPNKLFRRVQDERGVLTISRNAAVFHPGRGVYRSSYMNARRLAATETNMAYRSADHERWKDLDFVVGIEIQTSNNHTTKDSKGDTVELRDICDELAGRYPKDFKFTGWHPHCRCIATTILKTEEEMQADTERILNGEEPLSPDTSKNYIGELPDKFTEWLTKNETRIADAKSLPYFLADNQGLINGVTANAGGGGNNGGGTPKTLQEQADEISLNPTKGEHMTLEELQKEYYVTGGTLDIRGKKLEACYRQGIAGKFDFAGVKKDITDLAKVYGIEITDCNVKIDSANQFMVTYYSKDGFHLKRLFYIDKDDDYKLKVYHAIFQLGDKYQGMGISKGVFRIMYEQYKNMGVQEMTVHANMNVGGYTWAKYGFNASSKEEALFAVQYSAAKPTIKREALSVIEDYYKGRDESDIFPMIKLVEELGVDENGVKKAWLLLKDRSWTGVLDLEDEEQRKIFEEYMYGKKK